MQILCSYVTLPLYALVTQVLENISVTWMPDFGYMIFSFFYIVLNENCVQMGSKMKPTVFNDRVATALKKWHHTAKNETKHGRHSGSNTPFSSRPTTPTHGSSPIHLLHNFNNRSVENYPSSPSPRYSGHGHHEHQFWDPESQHQEAETSTHHSLAHESSEPVLASVELPPIRTSKSLRDFSFKK